MLPSSTHGKIKFTNVIEMGAMLEGMQIHVNYGKSDILCSVIANILVNSYKQLRCIFVGTIYRM